MYELKELVTTGLKEGHDPKTLLSILAENIDCGHSVNEVYEHLYKEIYHEHLCDSFCKKLVEGMYNENEHGVKWTIEQTNEIARKIGISFSNREEDYTQYEFWCVMHMMYYDYGAVFQEQNITDDPILYAKMADAYIDDIDSFAGKLVDYFFFIEKKRIA